MSATHDVTQLLVQSAHGDKQALDDLTPLVYKELRRLAASHLRKERKSLCSRPRLFTRLICDLSPKRIPIGRIARTSTA